MLRATLTAAGILLLASAADGAEPVALRGLRAELAALLVQGIPGGGLPLAAAVFPAPQEGGAAGLAFLIELADPPAVETDGPRPLEVYAYAVDAAGEVVGHLALGLEDWRGGGEGVKVGGRLELPPGEISLRLLAWDPVSRRYGMAVRRVAVGPGLDVPRLAEDCAGWALAGETAAALGGLSARPVLVSGETRRLELWRPVPPGGWWVRLAAAGAGAGDSSEVAAAPATGGLEFVVPELPAGVYQLTVAAATPGGWSSPPLESWLVPAPPPVDGGCRRSWPRVLRLARAGPPAAVAVTEQPPARRPGRRLRTAYEALLGRLARGGDLIAAAAELAAFEARASTDELVASRQLFVAELQAARSLGKRDPRCLLPLIALHSESYRQHHRAGRFSLATHSRRLAAAIAELAVELEGSAAERSLIAVAVTGLADMVETRRASIEAQRLLEHALTLDGDQQAARLLLAVSYERKGRYADARGQLEQLVAANSAHYEARVRLAILLRRIGDRAAAERRLRALVAEQPPAWLLSLACQTLGQLLIRDARLGEAVVELRRAVARLPEDQAMRLLLAYALDRSGERRAVRETLAALPSARAAATPRYRYSDEPAAELGLLRETLRQSVTVRLPVLARALAGGRPEEAAG